MGVVIVLSNRDHGSAVFIASAVGAIDDRRIANCVAASSNFARSLDTLICLKTNTEFLPRLVLNMVTDGSVLDVAVH